MPVGKCFDHPGGGVVKDHWPSMGPNVWLSYCKECNRYLGREIIDGVRDLTDSTKMEWGKYAGVKLSEVPEEYLNWCVSAAMGSDAWNIALQRYLKQKGNK